MAVATTVVVDGDVVVAVVAVDGDFVAAAVVVVVAATSLCKAGTIT